MTKTTMTLTEVYAEKIRPLLPDAQRAYGSAAATSAPRLASNEYNELLLEYKEQGGNISWLARELGVSDATLRRRLRVARSGVVLGTSGLTRKRGSRDPEAVEQAAQRIDEARGDTEAYRAAVRAVYDDNVSLYAVADKLGMSYNSLYVALRSA